MAERKQNTRWVVSIHLTDDFTGERTFAPVLAAALKEYADSLLEPRPVANVEMFTSTGGVEITATIQWHDVECALRREAMRNQQAG